MSFKRIVEKFAAVLLSCSAAVLITLPAAAAENRTYSVTIKTMSDAGADTDSNVYIRLIGTDCSTETIDLDNGFLHDDFQSGSTETYTFTAPDVGTVTRIQLFLCEWKYDDGWEIESLEMNNVTYPFGKRLGGAISVSKRNTIVWGPFTNCSVAEINTDTGAWSVNQHDNLQDVSQLDNYDFAARQALLSQAGTKTKSSASANGLTASVFSFGSPVSFLIYGSVFVVAAAAAVWFVLRKKKLEAKE